MNNEDRFEPQDSVPLPPRDAATFTTAFDQAGVQE